MNSKWTNQRTPAYQSRFIFYKFFYKPTYIIFFKRSVAVDWHHLAGELAKNINLLLEFYSDSDKFSFFSTLRPNTYIFQKIRSEQPPDPVSLQLR